MAVQYAFSQITTQGLRLAVDAADPLSYPGSGTVLTDVSGNGFTGNVSSSISFVATNRGALYSANSSSAITFTGSAADFGSGSFTMEMTFTPQTINGQHFLYSKNSGSFPNFGAFLTGSNGSGRLVAFYNISSTISCSASTPTGSFITGSNYIVDVTYVPSQLATAIYTNSAFITQAGANGTGSLSTSASLFLLNNSTSSNVGSVANLYNFKVYNPYLSNPFIRKNYNAQAARFGLPLATYIPPAPLLLDTYSGAAAAYSLRKLRELYSGAAIRVRRSSDNAEADIGFDVNGELDTIALLAFCGNGDGFVTTWYDQSGNGYDATQTTAANQPQIVSNGSVLTKYGKPNIVLTSDFLNLPSSLLLNNELTMCMVMNSSATGGVSTGFINYNSSPADDPELRIGIGNIIADYYNGGYVLNFTDIQSIVGGLYFYERLTGYTSTIYRNNSFIASGTRSGVLASGVTKFTIGEFLNNTRDGNISELVIYASNQSTNRTGIETNINSFYSIY
jgi:hypothetical protein